MHYTTEIFNRSHNNKDSFFLERGRRQNMWMGTPEIPKYITGHKPGATWRLFNYLFRNNFIFKFSSVSQRS
jgi:hypothetical protein